MLCFSLSFAQLSVQNDAYIFVSDQVLFVTEDVNIDDVNSKIYLRNEAQLLQNTATITSNNSGEGQLSVYQTGNVNQWSYNYWCSPVGNNSAASGNEPARTNLLKDATNIASPGDPLGVTSWADASFTTNHNGSSSPLTISDRWLWTYQISNQYADWAYAGSTGNINPGLGFTMKGNGSGLTGNQIYDFRGKPNNGRITNNVATGLNTLIGNPYPSALDSALFIHDTDNQVSITGTLLFWEQDGAVNSHVLQDYRGGYYSFTINSAGTVITDTAAPFMTYDEQDNAFPLPIPTDGIKSTGRYIPIGQGFMVEGATGTPVVPATVYTKNSHRVFVKESGGQSNFFRNNTNNNSDTNQVPEILFQENGLSIVPEDFKRFRINVDFTVNEAQYTRQLVLNFHHSATEGFDYGLELIRNESSASDIYLPLDEKIFSGQAFSFQETLKIPLVVTIEQQQPLRFRIFDIQNFEESQGIYLHDIEDDVYVNLRALDYDLNIEPGHYSNRFEIVFTSDALNIKDFDTDSLVINQNNGIHQLSVINPKNIDITSIEVYDISGKLLLNGNYDAVLNRYELSTTNLSDGVYVVNINSKTTAIKSQKVIVKN
jgi:hypothetical protein